MESEQIIEYSEAELDLMKKDIEMDLENFTLSERTEEFFTQLAGFVNCKKKADSTYKDKVQSPENVLLRPEFKAFGASPTQGGNKFMKTQDGNKFMTLDKVMEDAKQKKAAFDGLLRRIVEDKLKMKADQEVLVEGKPIVKPWGKYKVLTLAGLKSAKRAREKIDADYGGNAKFLCDVGRATIVGFSEEEIANVLLALQEEPACEIVRIKNRFAKPTYTGTRDILMNIKVENHIFEIQVHQADLLAWDAKGGQHTYYEFFREYFSGKHESYQTRMEIFDKLGETVRKPNITGEIRKILEGEDEETLSALREITKAEIFSDLDLHLMTLKRQQALLGFGSTNHEARLDGLHDMVEILRLQAKHEEALRLGKRVLKDEESTLGKNHPVTFGTINNVASVYYDQGNYGEALKFYKMALEGQIALIEHHFSTSDTRNNIGNTHMKLKNYNEALEFYGQARKGYESALGEDDPKTFMVINNMAIVYFHQENYEKALEMYEQALKGKEGALGKDHPSTLETVNNMGLVHWSQKNYETALKLYERALEGYEAALEEDHPSTLDVVNNMGVVYMDKALASFRRALGGRERALGKGHPSTVGTLRNIGKCLHGARRIPELVAHIKENPQLFATPS